MVSRVSLCERTVLCLTPPNCSFVHCSPLFYFLCSFIPGDPCKIQPRFNGFAVGFKDDALKFDLAQKTDGDIKFFDGFSEYEYVLSGDRMYSFGLGIKIPGSPPIFEGPEKLKLDMTSLKAKGSNGLEEA